ncbi:tRNA glutamyl-Q(34) synthetase GluQRS [Ferrovibrio sp.]|uniref:tRNA glutamyl-Q(34) synthetase GluQRS n=1 Tax=Ferrovibrio sp. TaxID=1917215 RepID=UPI000CBF971A|nr:tRNA glutamyl-Q(34) synthetase GluQRS [Ferrovibrio sp.]PJI39083.1 MAG: tRNA glutamyl-Q(34) synthetase GluQRS [Ferrovibrio sp.]
MQSDIVTRCAPSPTGYLHLGHAYAAGIGWLRARQAAGRFLLRIEDIDTTRCRPDFTRAIFDDLHWLGLSWEEPVRLQSEHFAEYAVALDSLQRRGLLYPCFCTRKQIQAEIAAAGHAPHGFEGAVYPGNCRHLSADKRAQRIAAGEAYALRLDMAAACQHVGPSNSKTWPLHWQDEDAGQQAATPELLVQGFGDVVLARKEIPASYHLCVTHDDALQGITLVTRGSDLFAATHLHRLLQALFGWPVPAYAHHPLLVDDTGERLAKRKNAPALRDLRAAGVTPAAVWQQAGLDPAAFPK